jgi:hypothetical protein
VLFRLQTGTAPRSVSVAGPHSGSRNRECAVGNFARSSCFILHTVGGVHDLPT